MVTIPLHLTEINGPVWTRQNLWGPAPPSLCTRPLEEVRTGRGRQNGRGPHDENGAAGGNYDNRIISESDLQNMRDRRQIGERK